MSDGGVPVDPAGIAAGLGNFFGGVKAAAMRVANYATYYVMKNRAGLVGRKGVRQVVEQILAAAPNVRVHLIGHSFGARVKNRDGFFRRVVAGKRSAARSSSPTRRTTPPTASPIPSPRG